MDAKLVVVGGKAQAEEFSLKLPAIVGRSRSADVPLNHPLVSRQHCELFEADGRLMVRDLGSLNGTFVGDSRVAAEVDVLITPGGHLTVGSVTFEAVYEAAPGENDEAPDFSLSDETVDVGETVETSEGQHAAAPAEEASPQESSGEGFDMSWLNEGSEEAVEPAAAPAQEAAESAQDLEPPADDAEQTIQQKAPPARRGAKAKEAKRGAAKQVAQSKQEAKPKPEAAAAAPAPAEDVPTEFAPAEGGAHEGGGDEDMDDFFRSLTAP